jgi:hypothetical protein
MQLSICSGQRLLYVLLLHSNSTYLSLSLSPYLSLTIPASLPISIARQLLSDTQFNITLACCMLLVMYIPVYNEGLNHI